MDTKLNVTVHDVMRLPQSRLGNPKFRFFTTGGYFDTKTNTGQAIRVTSDFRIDEYHPVEVTLILHNHEIIDWIKY